MGGACGTYGIREMHIGFLWGKLKEREHLQNTGLYERIILKWALKNLVVRA